MWVHSAKFDSESDSWLFGTDILETNLGAELMRDGTNMAHMFLADEKQLLFVFREEKLAEAFQVGMAQACAMNQTPRELYDVYVNKYINMALDPENTKYQEGDLDGYRCNGEDWDKY